MNGYLLCGQCNTIYKENICPKCLEEGHRQFKSTHLTIEEIYQRNTNLYVSLR